MYFRIPPTDQGKTTTQLHNTVTTYEPSPHMVSQSLPLQINSSGEMEKMLTQLMIEQVKPKSDHSNENLLRLISLLAKLNNANEQKLIPLENYIKKNTNTIPLKNIINPNQNEPKETSNRKQEVSNIVISKQALETPQHHKFPTPSYNEPVSS